ncbi:hypothetical protein NL108_017648 [Boleophthalmus pectinirostris]|nr:hypothetical protein NL108_017648 [Boleophthalmus pectinirostris]
MATMDIATPARLKMELKSRTQGRGYFSVRILLTPKPTNSAPNHRGQNKSLSMYEALPRVKRRMEPRAACITPAMIQRDPSTARDPRRGMVTRRDLEQSAGV